MPKLGVPLSAKPKVGNNAQAPNEVCEETKKNARSGERRVGMKALESKVGRRCAIMTPRGHSKMGERGRGEFTMYKEGQRLVGG